MNLTADFRYMALALFVAYRALALNETPVACVLVADGAVVSIGYNDTNRSLNGTRHAEFIAMEALEPKVVARSTLYVTVEPCIMCAAALRQMKVPRVVFGCGNDRFGGHGTVLAAHGALTQSCPGVMRTEAIQLLRNFYIQENDSAPDPQIKKNKDLEGKHYPPMHYDKYMTRAQFEQWSGRRVYNGDRELTPQMGHGYRVRDLITAADVRALPRIEKLYPHDTIDAIDADLEEFCRLFYPISGDGAVDFNANICVYQQKSKRQRLQ